MRNYWFLIVTFFLFSCKAIEKSDKIASDLSTDVRQKLEEIDPKIVFLYFELENSDTQDIQIHLNQIQVVEGKMKENTTQQAPKSEGNLIVQLLDESSQIQVERIIENPLTIRMEQYSEAGEINANQLELESGFFFIRFNHKDTIKALKIYSIQSGKLVEVYNKPLEL